MYFLNCLSSLKTCSEYANNKRNTILRYWRWIHFVIWPSVYALRISQYSFVSLPNETAREKRRWGGVIRFILKKSKTLLCIFPLLLRVLAFFKELSTSTVKGASPLKGDKMWTFKRLQATLKLSVKNCSFNAFPLTLSLIFTYSPFFFS